MNGDLRQGRIIAEPKDEPESTSRTNPWLKSNLAALGSAAVLAVYAAGYVKTQPAAERFANEAEARDRRPSPPRPVATTAPTTLPTPAQPAPIVVEKKSAEPPAPRPKRATTAATAATQPKAKPADVVDSTTTAPAPVTPPVVAPVPAPTPAPTSTPTPPPADTAKHADVVPWKDGIYFGWGTSRHGDVQAGLVIKNGRIMGASITECRTQYSCSWIDALPAQVVARQSADVDFVSGATQSTNAFYYAVVQALSKAK